MNETLLLNSHRIYGLQEIMHFVIQLVLERNACKLFKTSSLLRAQPLIDISSHFVVKIGSNKISLHQNLKRCKVVMMNIGQFHPKIEIHLHSYEGRTSFYLTNLE